MKQHHLHYGVSIVELMVALAILALLMMIAVPAYDKYLDERDYTQAKSDIVDIQTRIDRFYVNQNRFPNTLEEVNAHTMRDPWNNLYLYHNMATGTGNSNKPRKDKKLKPVNSDYDLYTMGKDRQTAAPFTSGKSRDDIVRCNNGQFIGFAEDY